MMEAKWITLRAAAMAFLASVFLPVLPADAQTPALAQAPTDAVASESEPAPAEEPAATLETMDAQLRLLERKLEVKEEEEEKKRNESADKLPNTLLIRRVRPVWEGTLARHYNFRVMPEFSGTSQILDAYSELAFWPQARLRVGRSKTPFGLERLKSAQDMDLIEFAHPTSLTPNYDMGISLLGDLLDESVSYHAGVFNGAVDGGSRDAGLNDDKDLIGRVFALPFKSGNVEPVRGLGIGFAAGWGMKKGDIANTDLAAYRTEGQQTFFSYRSVAGDTGTVRAFGEGYRLNPQGYWYYGPFGLFGEYVASTQEYAKGGATAAAGGNRPEEKVFFSRIQTAFYSGAH